jgi:ABC-2 type transport system permease protein
LRTELLMQSFHRIGTVGLRVIRQIKRDRRTIALVVISPIILMVLLGYSLAGTMSGIGLGVVQHSEGAVQQEILKDLQSSDSFSLTYLASEADAHRLISDGSLDGAVVLEGGEVRLLLDGTSPQVASAISAQVGIGMEQGLSLILRGIGNKISAQDDLPSLTTYYVYGYDLEAKDSVGPALLGISIFFFTFLTTTISFLRERLLGTLEKVLASPLSKFELVSGYILGFIVIAFFQSATTFTILVLGFKVPMQGSLLAVLAVIILVSAGALSFGAFLSNFARSEFQVIQFIPVVITPQIVLSGVWLPLQSIPEWLRPVAYIFPLTYSNHALRLILLKGATLADVIYPDIIALAFFFLLTFLLAVRMLQRQEE